VFCYPIGKEYMDSHRAFLRFAVLLSESGFHAFRFDYYGTGDSSGNAEEATMELWLQNISTAIEELKNGCGLEKVDIVGMRLGGTLALLSAAQRSDVGNLVLWNPIWDGRAYLTEIRRKQEEFFIKSMNPKCVEYQGFPVSNDLGTGLSNFDISRIRSRVADRIFILDSNGNESVGQKNAAKSSWAPCVCFRNSPGFRVWREEPNKPIVPETILRDIISWLGQ